MWLRPPAAVFMTQFFLCSFFFHVLGKVFVFHFLNFVIKSNVFKMKSLTAKEHI